MTIKHTAISSYLGTIHFHQVEAGVYDVVDSDGVLVGRVRNNGRTMETNRYGGCRWSAFSCGVTEFFPSRRMAAISLIRKNLSKKD